MGALAVIAVIGLAGCGRIAFDPRDDAGAASGDASDAELDPGFIRFPMDLDPAGGMIEAVPASRSVACGAMCPMTSADHMVGTAAYEFDETIRPVIGQLLPPDPSPYTITVWLRPNLGIIFASALSKPLGVGSLNDVSFVVADDHLSYEGTVGGNPSTVDLTGDFRGTWFHVAMQFDGSQRSLYVDGALAGTDPSPYATSSEPIALGADDDGGFAIPYGGLMDDLRIYPRALTSTEISTIHGER